MKVFFAGSYIGTENNNSHYSLIYDGIKNLGYLHLDDDAISPTTQKIVKDLQEGRESSVELYKEKMKAIHDADICVFETSYHNMGIGFLVERALAHSKPTIILHYKELLPYFLSGIQNEKLIVRSYDTENLEGVLKEALQFARERRDKRFNFFLTPKLLAYLEVASNKRGITKSKFIRDMIIEHMRQRPDNTTQ